MKTCKQAAWMILLLLAFLVMVSDSLAQDKDQEFFAETGHWVRGVFYQKWQSVKNPYAVFGQPISAEFVNSEGIKVQYFQRCRMEYHPENPPTAQVIISDLGPLLLAEAQAYIKPLDKLPANHPACLSFDNAEFQICYAFKDFFLVNGGLSQFGYPISDLVMVNGWLVQYFERARLEWRPERASGQRVVLTDIGTVYFDTHEDSRWRKAELESTQTGNIKFLRVKAFTALGTVPPTHALVINIIIRDQLYNPIPDTLAEVLVTNSAGEAYPTVVQTDKDGKAQINLQRLNEPKGRVHILVTVSFREKIYSARTSYEVK